VSGGRGEARGDVWCSQVCLILEQGSVQLALAYNRRERTRLEVFMHGHRDRNRSIPRFSFASPDGCLVGARRRTHVFPATGRVQGRKTSYAVAYSASNWVTQASSTSRPVISCCGAHSKNKLTASRKLARASSGLAPWLAISRSGVKATY